MALGGVALMRMKKELEMLFHEPSPGVSAWVKEEQPSELEAGRFPHSPPPLSFTYWAARAIPILLGRQEAASCSLACAASDFTWDFLR